MFSATAANHAETMRHVLQRSSGKLCRLYYRHHSLPQLSDPSTICTHLLAACLPSHFITHKHFESLTFFGARSPLPVDASPARSECGRRRPSLRAGSQAEARYERRSGNSRTRSVGRVAMFSDRLRVGGGQVRNRNRWPVLYSLHRFLSGWRCFCTLVRNKLCRQ